MIWALLAGAVTGLLSGFGIGGGTLLMIYMTALAGLKPQVARGTNLLYFIPCSAAALVSHIKNGLIEKKAAAPAIIAGAAATLAASFLANAIDPGISQKLFGGFLVVVGAGEFFRKDSG
jgi:uncharacterized membrane protein YfcA